MPICPYCRRFVKKSHYNRHIKSCMGGRKEVREHVQISRTSAAKMKKRR